MYITIKNYYYGVTTQLYFSRQGEANPVLCWLVARMSNHCFRFYTLFLQGKKLFWSIINPFLTNLAQTGWLDNGLVLFMFVCLFVCCCGPRWKNSANIQPSWRITYNGNWTEWSVIWSEIMRLISKVWFRTKICLTGSSLTTLLHQFYLQFDFLF